METLFLSLLLLAAVMMGTDDENTEPKSPGSTGTEWSRETGDTLHEIPTCTPSHAKFIQRDLSKPLHPRDGDDEA
jgi:hypothetical protein